MNSFAPVPLAWPPTDVAIAASLLSCDPLALLDEAQSLHRAGVDWLHVDVMDPHFVPNFGITPAASAQLVARQPLPIDVHLMVREPLLLIDHLAQAGVSIITVHASGTEQLGRSLMRIRELGVRAGVALSPETPIAAIEELAADIDMVLMMSVHPGFSGQRLLPQSYAKLERLEAWRARAAPEVVLAVDGGVDAQHACELTRRGARVLVAGKALGGTAERQTALETLRGQAGVGQQEFYRHREASVRGMKGSQSL